MNLKAKNKKLHSKTKQANNPELCLKDKYSRGVGTIPTNCSADDEKIGQYCYQKCPNDFRRNGLDCHQNCPSGWSDNGLFVDLLNTQEQVTHGNLLMDLMIME